MTEHDTHVVASATNAHLLRTDISYRTAGYPSQQSLDYNARVARYRKVRLSSS